jgi:hypothetical protein
VSTQHVVTISVWDILSVLFLLAGIWRAACWAGDVLTEGTRATAKRVAGYWREAAEVRHRRRVELALILAGQHPGTPVTIEAPLPAAVIPYPPGARPAGVPGECQHERIVPVLSNGGDLLRWVCANYVRCEAWWDRSIAVYEPAGTPPPAAPLPPFGVYLRRSITRRQR